MITPKRKQEFLEANKYPNISLSLHSYCSHGCWYCCSDAKNLLSKKTIIDEIGIDKYIQRILELAGDEIVDYRVNGGEPLESKYILKILDELLSAGHHITLLSNITHIENIIDVCYNRKEQIHFEASFHLGAYLKQPDRITEYLKYFWWAVTLASEMGIVIVLTPDVLAYDKLEKYIDILFQLGIDCNCKTGIALQELYNKDYPRAYTDKERDRIKQLSKIYDNTNHDDIDSIMKINRVMYLQGMDCFLMCRMMDVHDDGDVSRCGSGYPYKKEKLLTTQMRLSNDFSPCTYETCLCVSRGIGACLVPNGLNHEDYCKMKGL